MINVKAVQGLKVPKEEKPREYISESKAEKVPASAYYRRLVADGSLIDMDTRPSAEAKAKKGGEA
jgi:hypothetical protein